MDRQITPHRVIADIPPYMTVAADKESGKRQYIKSRREHREFLNRNGYEEIGNEKFTPNAPLQKTIEPDISFGNDYQD